MDSADPHLGRVLANQYRIDSVLGEGGMGTVYRGVQLSVDRPVAIKLISQAISGSPEHVQRFRREAEAMSRLEHPAIVRLYDFGLTDDGLLYLVMELLAGRDLSKDLLSSGPIAPERALRLCLRILNALRKPHELGIVHRDLKPQNIFLTEIDGDSDFVKIMDFGLARLHDNDSHLTRVGDVMGTPAYMSPEQAQGHAVDLRSDLYAVGIVLFVMLTGEVPFRANTAMALLAEHISSPPLRLEAVAPGLRVPPSVQHILDLLLAKSPAARPASAAEAATHVHAALSETASMAAPAAASVPRPDVQPASPSPSMAPSNAGLAPSAGMPHARSLAAKTVTAPPKRKMGVVIGGAVVALAAIVAIVLAATAGGDDPAETAASTTGSSEPGDIDPAKQASSLGASPAPADPDVVPGEDEGEKPTATIDPDATNDPEPTKPAGRKRAAGLADPYAPPAITPAPGGPPPPIVNPPTIDRRPKPGQPLIGASRPPVNERKLRRQRLLKRGPPVNNMTAARKAYKAGKISSIELEDIRWVLGRYRTFKKNRAKRDLAAGRINKRQFAAAVAEADRFYQHGPKR